MSRIRSALSAKDIRFPHLQFLYSLKPTRMKLGLENISRLLERIGNPQMYFPSVIVAGTNGKGSVTSYISSILMSAGLRVGAFYSPHLIRINERIKVNGREIPTHELDRLLGKIRRFHRDAPFTFFEGLVAVSILYFVERRVDAAVFEVGLGGRLDATRLVNAVLTVITGVSLDHVEHLGTTREAILDEKLCVARAGVPLVVNLPTAKLFERARRFCNDAGAPITNVRALSGWSLRKMDPAGMVFDLETPRRTYGGLESSLIGEHQLKNAATSVVSFEVLLAGIQDGKLNVSPALRRKLATVDVECAVRDGVANAWLPGRFQILKGSPRYVVDVSHNEEGLLASLRTLRRISRPSRSVVIFGIMGNKDPGSFPARVLGSAREVLLVPLRTRRGAGKGELLELFMAARERYGGTARVRVFDGCAGAMRYVERNSDGGDTVLILGSHRLVEDAVRYM